MTDNEIVKSLEICANNGDCKECCINPHKGNYGYCTSLAINAALALINRQKAEIEKLTINMNAFGLGMMREKERADFARDEAAKEFAEIIKANQRVLFNYIYSRDGFAEIIDKLVKEFTEDSDGQT